MKVTSPAPRPVSGPVSGLASCAIALAMLAGPPAPAQESQPPAADSATAGEGAGDTAPLWAIGCSSEGTADALTCELSQSIVMTDPSGQARRVATASFRRVAGAAETAARFALPLEVVLTGPARVAVDGKAVADLVWQSCDTQGCHAEAPVDDGWLKAMRDGRELSASVIARNGKGLTFTFQLRDFTRMERLMP